MEDTQTWLFVIEVGTSRLRNNVSLLHVHRGGETRMEIFYLQLRIKIHCELRNRRDNGTVKLGETIYIRFLCIAI